MSVNPGQCAACGASGDMHLHHLVPQVHGGKALPTVFLCVPCHAAVHDMKYSVQHKTLTKVGIAVAKAAGRHGGNPALKSRDPEGLKRLKDARNARSRRELMADAAVWLPVVLEMRPKASWEEVSAAIPGLRIGPEALRRRVILLVKEGLAPDDVLRPCLSMTKEEEADRLQSIIRMLNNGMSRSAIGSRLSISQERVGQILSTVHRAVAFEAATSAQMSHDIVRPLTERQ